MAGRGVGASHQTGWTGLIAKLLMPRTLRQEVVVPEAQEKPASAKRKAANINVS